MTNEQINAAIAEACGWTDLYHHTIRGWLGIPPESKYAVWPIPRYCSDLNAMHEAEKMLTVEQWEDYVEHVGGTWEQAMHAPARQRAEAFLRVLGKWEEDK